MPTSEARILANQANALKSTGPKTVEGKERSRRNGLKHGMAGRGVVVAADEAAEVERRHIALHAEMAPRSEMGEILVGQLATLSVRMERAARQEFAATAGRVRHAGERFDQEQVEEAEALLDQIGDDPRRALRRLKRTPSGVDALVTAWRGLRAELTREPSPTWDVQKLGRMAHLLGLRPEDLRGSRLEALSHAAWGIFAKLRPDDGAGLSDAARRSWACGLIVERVDEEVAGLDEHLETLDLEAFELDRVEAADRALFDDSKGACLARRYESEARRGFFRALKEFRQVEAEVEDSEVAPPEAPEPNSEEAPLASCRDGAVASPTGATGPRFAHPWPASATHPEGHHADRGGNMAAPTVGEPARGPA